MVRETVAMETFARSATARMSIKILEPKGGRAVRVMSNRPLRKAFTGYFPTGRVLAR